MEQQQTAPTKTSGPRYGQAFMVFHNPGRFFNNGNRWSDQGVLVIRGDQLLFADVKGRGFSVRLNEPTYKLDAKHHLLVTLPTGERWAFAGFYATTVVKPETVSLLTRYGINPEDTGGVSGYIESLKRQQTVLKSAVLTGAALAAESPAADGIGIAASARMTQAVGDLTIASYAKVDQFVTALRAHGLRVPAATPNLRTWIAYLQTNPKKNLVFLTINVLLLIPGFFGVAWLVSRLPFARHLESGGILWASLGVEVLLYVAVNRLMRRWRYLKPY